MINDLFNTTIAFVQTLPEAVKILLVVAVAIVLHMLYKLARSSTVNENGKVVVRYHSPTQWIARYTSQVAQKRRLYSARESKVLSSLYRGKSILQALASLLLGLLLSTTALFLFVQEPHQLNQAYPWVLMGSGVFFIAASIWL